MSRAAVVLVLLLVLVGCSEPVEVPNWHTMTHAERIGYCESIAAQYDGIDWRWGNHYQANRRMQAAIERCAHEGYL
jgi:hypothetical protein